MKFDEFERRSRELWDEVPEEYKEGVDGLVVDRGARPHPDIPDIFTLGECVTEAYPSDFGGPDTIRSYVVLYYGSFWRLSRLDDDFDWEGELWETLTHELRHHLESLATEDALEEVDYAADENFKRLEGEPFDPEFYRSGEPAGSGVWRIEEESFVEIPMPVRSGHPRSRHSPGGSEAGPPSLEFEWEGRRWRVPVPDDPGDFCFIEITAGPALSDGPLTLVLVRRRGLGELVSGLLRPRAPVVRELEAEATPVR